MDAASDLGALAEIAATARTPADYERDALSLIGRRVGFDVGIMMRPGAGFGDGAIGLDPAVARRCAPLWGELLADGAEILAAASRAGGVAVDLDVLGARRLERSSCYRLLMRPHGGRSTALMSLPSRGGLACVVTIGRSTPGFRPRELVYLRGLVPTLALCEAALRAPPPPSLELRAAAGRLTPREREVLGYLHLGYTNEQIARACGNAPRTVRNQLSRVYTTLGVATRAEAVAVALSLDLVP